MGEEIKPLTVGIIPTVGRLVYFKARGSADGVYPPRDFAAIITRVYDERTISVVSFSEMGLRFEEKITQGCDGGQWDWMPFQKQSASNSQSAMPRPETTSI